MIDRGEPPEGQEAAQYWKRHYGIGNGTLNPKARSGCMLSLVSVTALVVLLLLIRLAVAIA